MGYVRDVYTKTLSSASDDVDPAFLDIVDGPALCFEGCENTEREREGGEQDKHAKNAKRKTSQVELSSSPGRSREVGE